jgi:ribosomal protein L10
MINQGESRDKLETELFDSNDFKGMFDIAARRQLLIQENTLLLSQFYNLLNLDNLKELAKKEKIGNFLDDLIHFLDTDQHFNKVEKKKFLNGCENVLFLHALMLGKNDSAKYLNQFRVDKSLYLNRNFLTKRINEKNYEVVESLLDISDNVTYDESKVLRLLYVSLCRDYEFFKKLIAKYNFDINAYGDLGINDNFKGSFLHVLSLMNDAEANKFFIDFIKDYGSKINFDVAFTDSERDTEIHVLDLIINNEQLETSEKMSRLTTILTYGALNEKHVSHLAGILITDAIISRYYNDPIYDALFAHQSFNSIRFNREGVLNQLLKLDNSELFTKLRTESSFTINPTSVILDKFFRFSSPIQSNHTHPFILWINDNATNNNFSVDTLLSLIKHYKNELHELNLFHIKMPTKMAGILRQAGVAIAEKKGIMSKIFGKEKDYEEKTTITSSSDKKVEPAIDTPSQSGGAIEVNKPVDFNKSLFITIKDEEISQFVDNIVVKTNQLSKLIDEENVDYTYIKCTLPKLVNTTIENYFKFSDINAVDARKNALIQVKMLQKRVNDLIVKNQN